MNKSLLRTCLLILLSITLPLQAAVAASKGGCLRHTPDRQGPVSTAGVAGHGHSEGGDHHAGHDQRPSGSHLGGHRAGPKNNANPAQQAAQPLLAPADHSAFASSVGDAPCPHHQAADAPAASPEPDCNSCDWCCMGTALPSQALRWPASLAQTVAAPLQAWAYVSPHLPALERPPRALLSAA